MNTDEYEVEIRPVRRRDAVEAGLDYWIDEGDLERERERRIAIKNRKVCMLLLVAMFDLLALYIQMILICFSRAIPSAMLHFLQYNKTPHNKT